MVSSDLKKYKVHEFSKFKLSKNSNQFPFIVCPKKNEILSSWIARLAEANFSSFSYFLNNLYLTEKDLLLKNDNRPNFSNVDINTQCPPQIINILSEKTGIKKNEIEFLTMNS